MQLFLGGPAQISAARALSPLYTNLGILDFEHHSK